ncbi:MAG: hypothetical protein RBS72_21655 [Sedimentisphaerales bacterium]|jgi:hypothetical protein|nr:hypothetical protein [Sedimentisphaerales bacterium]HOH65633.1 hypothetical protein [Sedimentisphaerales bacterium]HQA90096.1 hypothetical protein [Sedimentisphaerales bacterium]
MRRVRVHHPPLPFPDIVRRERLPQREERQCRKLLSQMLVEVVSAERQAREGANHE